MFRRQKQIALTLLLCLACWLSISVQPAWAGRYVLNQPVDVINRHFGDSLFERTSQDGLWVNRYYSADGLRQRLPDLSDQAQLQMAFKDGRVQTISLVNVIPSPNGVSTNGLPFETSSDQPETVGAQFFDYIFGYPAPIFNALPYYSGGHEGFAEADDCLGDGVGMFHIYGTPGYMGVNLYYNLLCEPPYITDWDNVDFSDAVLSDADLSDYILREVSFERADLSRANLSRSRLPDANLSLATLINATLKSTNLQNSNFTWADLTGVDLSGAYAKAANFSSANLTGADLSRANLEASDFSDANLTNANLDGIRWQSEDVDWDPAKWEGVIGLETAQNIPEALRQQLGLE
ncbi:MAG: pentapeptide repeat-containing protein [Cyanobacteria bacterium P01_A01_bin.123]